MDPDLTRLIIDEENKRNNSFLLNHEMFVIAFPRKPIYTIGLVKLRKLNEEFVNLLERIRIEHKNDLGHVYFFKSSLPIIDRRTIPSRPLTHNINRPDFFWYVIFSVCTGSSAKRVSLRLEAKQQMEDLLASHISSSKILSGPSNRYKLSRHFEEQAMFIRERKPTRSKKTETKPSTIFAPMTVGAFFRQHNEASERIVNDLAEYIKYWKAEGERDYKYIREEHTPLYAFLKHFKINDSAILHLGSEKEVWDAKVLQENEAEIIIEITQALPEDDHIFRRESMNEIVVDLGSRTRHQRSVDLFPDPIIRAIANKHQRNYPEKRVLLVSVMGDYTEEDDLVIDEWIKEVRVASSKGNFSKIYLVDSARRKLFQIF
jgi:hypothetical protein